jgi:peptide deformylase
MRIRSFNVAIRRIVTVDDGNPVLRAKARPIARVNRRIRKLMDDMVETMRDADGVGLAAPQIGLDLRVIVVELPIMPEPTPQASDQEEASETLVPAEQHEAEAEQQEAEGEADEYEDYPTRVFALANAEIVWASEDMEEGREACLSIPGLFGDVPRHASIHVRGLDRSGEEILLELERYDARVFQHEIDHLDGRLYVDLVTGLDKLYTLEEDEEGEWVRVPYEMPSV